MRPTQNNISICGHAQHGKSTVAGRLMYALGGVTDKELEKHRKEAEQIGRDVNKFSMIFRKHRTDAFNRGTAASNESRMSQGRSVFPTWGKIALENSRLLTLVDTPGHEDFLDNLIYGIYLADMAIMTVKASAGVQDGTERVSRILSSFAIPTIAILVTQMDVVNYSEMIFDKVSEQIEEKIIPALQRYGSYQLPIIPVSALTGVGFGTPPQSGLSEKEEAEWSRGIETMKWYDGPDAIHAVTEPKNWVSPDAVSGVRFAVEGGMEIYSPPGVGTVLVGSLETGTLRPGEKLKIEPASSDRGEDIVVQVRSVQPTRGVNEPVTTEGEKEVSARAIVGVALGNSVKKIAAEKYLRHGGVLGRLNEPPQTAKEISAELFFFEPDLVYGGKEFIILTNTSRGVARIYDVSTEQEPSVAREEASAATGLRWRPVSRRHALSLFTESQGMAGYRPALTQRVSARLRFEKRLCIEKDEQYQRMTRFLLRDKNKIVACGRCLEIIQ
jgi:elongation factor 1-alpha